MAFVVPNLILERAVSIYILALTVQIISFISGLSQRTTLSYPSQVLLPSSFFEIKFPFS